MMFVVVSNERRDYVHGPFETMKEAVAWAHRKLVGFVWRVVAVAPAQ